MSVWKKSFFVKISLFTIACCVLFTLPTLSVMAHSGGEVTSKKTETPITIDGMLDEAEWDAIFQEASPLARYCRGPARPET